MPKFINGIGHIFTVVKLPKLIKPSGHTGTRMRDVIEREREKMPEIGRKEKKIRRRKKSITPQVENDLKYIDFVCFMYT